MAKNAWGDEVAVAEDPRAWGDKPAAQKDLPADVKPSTAGGGRGSLNPPLSLADARPARTVDLGPADESDPLTRVTPSTPGGAQPTFTVNRERTGSVLEDVQVPAVPFNPQAALTLSRRANAEVAPPETRMTLEPATRTASRRMTDAGAGLADSSMPVRAVAKAATSAAQGGAGLVRAAADAVGADAVAELAQRTGAAATDFEQGMGNNKPVEGFGPKSPVPYIRDMAEGASASLLTTGAAASMFGARAVIPLLSIQSAGAKYDEARNAGLDPAMAFANAVPTGIFEAVGEKFQGLDKAAAAVGVLMNKGSNALAKRTAADMLVRSGVKEIPGEVVTYLGQSAVDLLPGIGIKQDMTMGQFLDGLRDTVVQAGMMGTVQVAGGAAGRSSASQATPEQLAKAKGFLVADPRVERLNAAGEKEIAGVIQRRLDAEAADNELPALSGTTFGADPGFQQHYRTLRTEGVKPAEASTRAAMLSGFGHIGGQAGLSQKAIDTALDKAKTMPVDKVPGFLEKFAGALGRKGMGQGLPDGAVSEAITALGDDAMRATTETLYADDTPASTMAAIEDLEQPRDTDGNVLVKDARGMDVRQGPHDFDAGVWNAGNDVVITPEADRVHAAATSPLNDLPEPTEAQKKAGNYALGRLRVAGMDISVENPQGSVRRGTDADGKAWESPMRAAHYGYIRRTEGADGDHLDVFVKPGTAEDWKGAAFVIDQVDQKTGKLDEHKVIFGAKDEQEAEAIYRAAYDADWQGMGAITRLPMPAFKAWARSGILKEPLGDLSEAQARAAAAPVPAATPDPAPAELQPAGGGEPVPAGGQEQPDAALNPTEDERLRGKRAAYEAYKRSGSPDDVAGSRVQKHQQAANERGEPMVLWAVPGSGKSALLPASSGSGVLKGAEKVATFYPEQNNAGAPVEQDPPAQAQAQDLSPAQLAARAKAAVRLGLPSTSPKGEPIPAHAFIASEGGMSRETMADMGFDRNLRIGNRTLFAGKGKGLTLEQATLKLIQDGYLPEGSTHTDTANLIGKSLKQPQYNPEGWARIGEAEAATRFEDHLAAQMEAEDPLGQITDYSPEELQAGGLADDDNETRLEVQALLALLEGRGIDTETIREDASRLTSDQPDQAYYAAAKSALEAALRESGGDHGAPAGQQGNEAGRNQAGAGIVDRQPGGGGREEPTRDPHGRPHRQDVAAPAPAQTPATAGVSASGITFAMRPSGTLAVKGDPAVIREKLKDLPPKTLMVMQGGIMVGKTQAARAQALLEDKPAEPVATKPLSIGVAPGSAELVTVKDGTVFVGKYEAIDFESGEPITVPAGATDAQVKQALKDGGVLTKRQKFFGGADIGIPASEVLTAPTEDEVLSKQEREASAQALDDKAQIDREAAGQTLTSPTAPEQRKDTGGDMFALEKAQAELDKKNAGKPKEDDGTGALFARSAPWRSELSDVIRDSVMKQAPAAGWLSMLDGLAKRGGVKADEIEWTGLREWLEMQPGKVSKEAIAEYLDANGVQVEEVVKGDEIARQDAWGDVVVKLDAQGYTLTRDAEGDILLVRRSDNEAFSWNDEDGIVTDSGQEADEDQFTIEVLQLAEQAHNINADIRDDDARGDDPSSTKYSSYTLPGGENYREVLLTLPHTPVDDVRRTYMQAMVKSGASPSDADQMFREMEAFSRDKDHNEKLKDRGFDLVMKAGGLTGNEIHDAIQYGTGYKSSHWDEKNILAHIRVDDRVDADGKKVLMVQEIQSDWAQEGKREGFQGDVIPQNTTWETVDHLDEFDTAAEAQAWADKNPPRDPGENVEARLVVVPRERFGTGAGQPPRYFVAEQQRSTVAEAPQKSGVPRAPFIGKTDAWVTLALKRIVKMAADEGYDRVAFVTGKQSADRYSLSKQVESITYTPNGDGTFGATAEIKGRTSPEVLGTSLSAERLEATVGKEVAQKIIDGIGEPLTGAPEGTRVLSNMDLQVGGEGMKAFYDKIVPAATNKLLAKMGGGKMGSIPMEQRNPKSNPYFGNDPFDKADARVLERTRGVFQVWVKNKNGVEQLRGNGNFDSKEAAEAFIATGGRGEVVQQPSFDITPAMRQAAADGMPLFKRDITPEAFRLAFGTAGAPLTVTEVQGHVDKLTAKWKAGPKVKVVANHLDLGSNTPKDARGLYRGGTVYIVARKQLSRGDVARTLGHEAVAHFGLEQMLTPEQYGKLINNIHLAVASKNVPITKLRNYVRRAYVNKAGEFMLNRDDEAKEITARAVEEAIDPKTGEFRPGYSFLKSLWSQVAQWLRDMGFTIKFSNGELQGMLVRALRNIERGPLQDVGREPALAARDAGFDNAVDKAIDDAMRGVKAGYGHISVGTPSPRLLESGIPDRPLRTSAAILSKAFYDHGVTKSALKKLPDLLDDPFLVFDSDTVPGSFVVVTGLEVRGRPLIVAIKPDTSRGGDAFNFVPTLLPKDQPGAIQKWMDAGLLRLHDKKQSPAWFGSFRAPIARGSRPTKGSGGIVPPSGEDGGLAARSVDQTDTPAFKKWFGSSKVVDADGKPLVVYHGTSFDNIEALYPGERGTIHLTDDPKMASEYATNRTPDDESDEDAWDEWRGDSPNVMPVYVNARNLFDPEKEAHREALGGLRNLRGDWQTLEGYADKIKALGFDGILVDGMRDIAVFSSEQIKSATGNNGAFDGDSPNILYARDADTRSLFEPDAWTAPDPTRTDKVIYELQNGRVDLKRIQQAIETARGPIEQRFDAQLAETLYPGRVARRTDVFLDREVKPLLSAMAKEKASMDELADYLIARHAPERNAQVAKVNPDLPDGGAGRNSKGDLMTNDAAAAYLAGLSPERLATMAKLAEHVDEITRGTRSLLVAEGLEKQSTVDAWQGAYSNYVPLFKEEGEHPHPQGMGFNVKGPASKRSTGSTKQVTNVIAHVLMQREAAITRAEKNRVGLALYGLALSHPNPEFWTTIKPGMDNERIGKELKAMGVDPTTAEAGMERIPTVRSVDPLTQRVVDRPNPIYKQMPGAITLKVNGEDRVLMINTTTERGLRMAEALKNLDGLTAFNLAGTIVGKTTRWLAAINTQYNPAFGLVNLVRDTLGGSINLGSTALKGKTMQVLGRVPAAMQGIAREVSGGGEGSEWSKLWKQFQDDGGKTGYREVFAVAEDRAKAIEAELKAAQSAGKLTPGKVGHAVLDLLDGFNTTLENAVRLAAYKTALDQGLSRPQAARLGRELTVDFNRKGRLGRELGPLYAFFNASVQGGARTLEALRGPTGAKIIAGGLALGAIQALLLAAMGYEDDEIPEFVKTRALIIPLPPKDKEKRFIAIPYPLGLHVIPNVGRVATELSLNGGKELGKRTFNAVGEIASAFNPLGGGNIFTAHGALTTVAPTVVDPIVDLSANKNFAGNSIEKESPRGETDNRPGYQRAKESTLRSTTGQVYLGISKAVNALTGGTAYEAGKASPTPERIRYIAQTAGGGVLRELEKTIDSSVKAINGEKVKMSGIPVAGRFYGEVDEDQVAMSRYYDKGRALDKLQSSLTAAKQAGDGAAMMKLIEEHPELAMARAHDRVQREIAKLNKAAVSTVGDRDTIKAIDEARVQQMKALNEAIKDMEQAGGKPTLGQKLRGVVKPQELATQ